MKLKNDPNQAEIARQIIHYVEKTLQVPTAFDVCEAPPDLPVFLGRAYAFFEGKIAERQCLLMVNKDPNTTHEDLTKQTKLVQSSTDKAVIMGLAALSARDRSRLIRHGVAFIVPGNQLYIPALAMDLREHFKAQKHQASAALSPAAQAVLFHYLLRRNEAATTPSQFAKDLRYSAMSIGRAFDDLESVGLAETEKRGRERHIGFIGSRRDLMNMARPLLRSPVKSRKVVYGPRPQTILGGESALARLSDLAPPTLEEFAVLANDWKDFLKNYESADKVEDLDFVVETWSYDPAGLSDDLWVDSLSLYAQFWNHSDERIARAAEQLLEKLTW